MTDVLADVRWSWRGAFFPKDLNVVTVVIAPSTVVEVGWLWTLLRFGDNRRCGHFPCW